MYKRISWEGFNPSPVSFIEKRKDTFLSTEFICMDTETSNNGDFGWIYNWAFDYLGEIIMGRKPSQLVKCLKQIHKVNNLGYNEKSHTTRKMIIFIHNLAYDYEYIKDWLKKEFGAECKMLATGKHKLITWEIAGFEFRCTFRLTLKSLEKWSKEMGVAQKKTGLVDHKIVRYQDTELTDDDMDYMAYDIIALRESVTKQMQIHGHNISNIPFTVTGYVREATRKEFKRNYKPNRTQFTKEALDLETYKMCKEENAGGITHGNRYMAEITQRGCIRHRDFVSHYPTQQKCAKAPTGHFTLEFKYDEDEGTLCSLNDLAKLSKKKCFLVRIIISNMKLKSDKITMPYAQHSKFFDGRIDKPKFYTDNGRILEFEGACRVTLNEIDLEIIRKQYDFQYLVLEVRSFNKGAYPQYLQDTVDKYFYEKTLYKDKEKEIEKRGDKHTQEWLDNHIQLSISKGMLNGIFGMSDTDPVHIAYSEGEGGNWITETLTEAEVEETLGEYYGKKNSFMSYQLGVWTTANARKQLMDMVELIGYDNFIYGDTDSIFYYSTPEIEERIEAYNKRNREIGEQNGWYVEVNGRKVYYNQFDLEDEDIVAFKFLHAKCYAYEVRTIKDGKEVIELEAVIAGVKRNGRNGNTRINELGNIDELQEGKVFTDCGGTQISYNYHEPTTAFINGHETEFASSGIIFDVDKTLHGMWHHGENRIEYEKGYET